MDDWVDDAMGADQICASTLGNEKNTKRKLPVDLAGPGRDVRSPHPSQCYYGPCQACLAVTTFPPVLLLSHGRLYST